LGLTQKYLDELTYELIGAAIEVHKTMGRGLLESVYHECLKEELLCNTPQKIDHWLNCKTIKFNPYEYTKTTQEIHIRI